jgi:hypothetical protein
MNAEEITRNTTVMRGKDKFRFYTISFHNSYGHRGETKILLNGKQCSTFPFEISSDDGTMKIRVAGKIELDIGVGRNNLGDIDTSLFNRVVKDVTQSR